MQEPINQSKTGLTGADGRTPLSPQNRQNNPPKKKSDILSTLAKWIITVLSIIPRFFAAIMEHFTEAGSVGAVALGSLVFVVGVLLTTDSYWQSLFQGVPLFPFFEQSWAGWSWLPGFALFPLVLGLGLFSIPRSYLLFLLVL